MNDSHIDTLDKVRQFLGGTDEIDLAIDGKKNRYDFIKHALMRFKYNTLSKVSGVTVGGCNWNNTCTME